MNSQNAGFSVVDDHFSHPNLVKWMSAFILLVSILLLVSISIEILRDEPFLKESINFKIQLIICIYFTIDFFIFWYLSKNRKKFIIRYGFILLLSIPYLEILNNLSIPLSYEQICLIRFIPIMRGGVALIFLLTMIIKRDATAVLLSYLVLLLSIIYFLSLIFFVFERNINTSVHGYGSVVWWAAMTVTTLGSNIIPVTVAGKAVTTALATVGLTIFPIFTVYITTIVIRISKTQINTQIKS